MSRTRRPVSSLLTFQFPVTGVVLATALAVGASAVIHAQNPAPPAQQPASGAGAQSSGNQGVTTGGATGSSSAASTSTAPSGATSAADSSGGASKHPPVCFKLTGRCVEAPKGQAAAKGSASKDGTSNKRPLNLAAPDVRTVVPAEELKEPLPTNDQITETQEAQTVSVKTDAGVPPDVPGGFGALWWALNHPSQAWRILTPAE